MYELSETIIVGDEVVILPTRHSPPERALEIAEVAYANSHFVGLGDHRIYAVFDRRGLTPRSDGFLELATDEHRSALQHRRFQ
jgi:hypothetical protein